MPVLEQAGYEVIAPNLPGSRTGREPPELGGADPRAPPGRLHPRGHLDGRLPRLRALAPGAEADPGARPRRHAGERRRRGRPGGTGRDHSPPPRGGLRRLLGGPGAEALLGRRVGGGRRAARGRSPRGSPSRAWSPPSRRSETGSTRRPRSRTSTSPRSSSSARMTPSRLRSPPRRSSPASPRDATRSSPARATCLRSSGRPSSTRRSLSSSTRCWRDRRRARAPARARAR